MTKRTTNKTTAKKTSTKNTSTRTSAHAAKAKPQAKTPRLDLPAPETVVRHELIGYVRFTLADPREQLPEAAREALFAALKHHYAHCVVQCEGYVFNLVGIPAVTLVDANGKVTRSFANLDEQKPAQA